MNNYTNTLKKYGQLNKTAKKNAAVFFGADWLSEIPIAEAAGDCGINMTVYNRSLKGLTLNDAEDVIDTCLCELAPVKVFINIGENDFANDEFAEKYEWLLYTINAKCDCDLYILSVVCNKGDGMNKVLKSIAEKYGCEYIDILDCKNSFLKFFAKIRFFLRKHPISFCEAMSM